MTCKKEERSERGAAFVELALAIPILLLLGFYFYDVSITALCRIWQQSTVGQFVRSIEKPPVVAEMITIGANQQLTVRPLSDSELGTEYMPRLVDQLTLYLSKIASGAASIPNGAAIQLHLIDIDTGENNSASAGYPKRDVLALNNPFFTSAASARCFDDQGGGSGVRRPLASYAEERMQIILNAQRENLPPFGTNLFDIPMYNPVSREMEYLDSYLEIKPLLFVMLCSRPFRFFSSSPVTSLHTVFFDKEVQFQ
ncbi:MAG: hypothetical protein ACO3XO_09050 [Bdellovibrionota bacterium]